MRVTPHHGCRVPPFGHPRITALLTAPRGLSRPDASFIGSWYQGIHRAPLHTYTHNPQRIAHTQTTEPTHGPHNHQTDDRTTILASTIQFSNTQPTPCHPGTPHTPKQSHDTGMNPDTARPRKHTPTPRTPHPHTTDQQSPITTIKHRSSEGKGTQDIRACLLRTQQYAAHHRPTRPPAPEGATRNTRINSTFVMIHP
jgi:hypothetical protein